MELLIRRGLIALFFQFFIYIPASYYIQSKIIKEYPTVHFSFQSHGTQNYIPVSKNKICMNSALPKTKMKKSRIDYNSLQVNQKLKGKVVQLLDGKNGPKAWFNVDVYRPSANGTTRFVNAMLRINEESKKDAERVVLGAKMPVYVSNVQKANGRLVCTLSPRVQNMGGKRKVPKPKVMLTDLKPGQKLIGEVKDVLPYAAFVDCAVGVEGSKGRIKTIHGILHLNDLGKETALSHQIVRSANVKRVIEKGIDIEVYVKRASPDSAQLSFTLEPDGIEERLEARRKENRRKRRRQKDRKKLSELKIGSERPAQILEVRNYGFIVDTGARRRGLVHLKTIKKGLEFTGNDDFVDLTEYADPGDWIKVKVESVEDDRLYLDFLNFEETKESVRRRAKSADTNGNSQVLEAEAGTQTSSSPKSLEEEPTSMSALFGDDEDDDDFYDEYD